MSILQTKTVRYSLTAAVIILGLLGYLHLKLSLDIARTQRPYIYDNQYLLPSSTIIKAASLNYKTAASDLVWIGAVLHVADSHISKRKAPDSTLYTRTIIDLDPLFYKVYEWHAAARMMVSGYPSEADIDAANDILKVGMTYFPYQWQLPYGVVANYIGFSGDLDPETRLKQLEDGARHAEIAASLPGAPDYLPLLATSFHRKVANLRAGQAENAAQAADATPEEIEFLARLYLQSDNESTRALIAQRLESYGEADYLLKRVADYQKAFQQAHKNGLDYLTPDMFTLIDPGAQKKLEAETEVEN